jgi:hypothetical protein
VSLFAQICAERSAVDEEFVRFFEKLGYQVGLEGEVATGERWHEIFDGSALVCQVKTRTPLADFLADLPHLAEGRSGMSPTDYWCACEDDGKLRAMIRRISGARP